LAISKFKKVALIALMMMALGTLAACSSTGEGGNSEAQEDCISQCAAGDLDCREQCVMDLPI
jgi:hypothetical protein